MSQHISAAGVQFTKLIQLRQAAYARLGRARDALFELADAAMLTPRAGSLAELSLSPVFRRRWPSVYEALQDGRPEREALFRLYVGHLAATARPVLAGDHTAWPRLAARTLRDRTIEHQPTRVYGNRPITIGQGYSTLAWVPEATGSWALPLLHERIGSGETPLGKGSDQLRRVCAFLPGRPLTLWDAEYGCAPFVLATADIPADKVLRLRPNLCLWSLPPPYAGRGRPRVHGVKFKLKGPDTWGQAAATWEMEDAIAGRVRVSLWRDLHFRKASAHPMNLWCIQRLDAQGLPQDRNPLWLAWIGQEPPPLPESWQLYLRRFAVDHWYRFAKQRLHWTLPQVSTPEQSERWSDLMPLLTWQLWLARDIVADKPLPWQKPQAHLTPGRVCQSLGSILAVIGTPAQAPKPRGKSPGWRKGRPRQHRTRYPVVKKRRKKAA